MPAPAMITFNGLGVGAGDELAGLAGASVTRARVTSDGLEAQTHGPRTSSVEAGQETVVLVLLRAL